MAELLLLLALAAIVAAVLFAAVRMSRRQGLYQHSPEIEAAYKAAGFEVSITWLHGAARVRGTLSGVAFLLALNPDHVSRGMREKTALSLAGVRGENFRLEREAGRDLSGRDNVELALPDAKAREAARALFGLGFTAIELSGAGLRAINQNRNAWPRLEELRTWVEHLAVIAARRG